MSDVSFEGAPPLVPMLYESWNTNVTGVKAADEKLNTDAGATAIQRRCAESLDPNVVMTLEQTLQQIFKDMEVEQVTGMLYTISQNTAEYRAKMKEYIEAEQKRMPQQEIPEAEITALRDQRKDYVKAANALRVAVKTAAPAWADVDTGDRDKDGNVITQLDVIFPEQKNLRGSGPRTKSPRLKGSFIWVVDDEPVDGEKVSDVAKAIGVSVLDFKNALIANFKERGVEFDFDDPPKYFAFDLLHGNPDDPEGHTVYKVKATRKDSDPESDSDDSDEDESFDEPDENDELFQ
jgi:hypothetical protein